MPEKRKKSIHYKKLVKKWIARHKNLQKEIFEKHKDSFEWFSNNSKQLAVGSLAGIYMLTSPIIPQIPSQFASQGENVTAPIDKKIFLIYDLKNILPQDVKPLTEDEDKNVSEILSRTFGVRALPELEGKRLNRSYGIIGQEQHLQRYPGDNMYSHFQSPEDAEKYWNYGMAPGLGGWGYFAKSENLMTKELSDREKYYIAVQTFLSPGYDGHIREYVDFFGFRKMLVVNPENGKAMVVVIGDAGPAPWTGKHLGGSPEVMNYLERFDGAQRGPVLYYFIDDPENKIPLGPISI